MSSNLQPVVVLIYSINFHVFSLNFFFTVKHHWYWISKGGQAYMWPNSQKKKIKKCST